MATEEEYLQLHAQLRRQLAEARRAAAPAAVFGRWLNRASAPLGAVLIATGLIAAALTRFPIRSDPGWSDPGSQVADSLSLAISAPSARLTLGAGSGMSSADCPQRILDDILRHFSYQPDVPPTEKTARLTVEVQNGQFAATYPVAPQEPFARALHSAVLTAAVAETFRQPACGSPSGTFDLLASYRRHLGQWQPTLTLGAHHLR
jgi:hypothetical protein